MNKDKLKKQLEDIVAPMDFKDMTLYTGRGGAWQFDTYMMLDLAKQTENGLEESFLRERERAYQQMLRIEKLERLESHWAIRVLKFLRLIKT